VRCQGRNRCTVGREDEFAAAALADGKGHHDGDDKDLTEPAATRSLSPMAPNSWTTKALGSR
jgi:hypothetical protein